MTSLIWVFIGGGLGSICRFGVSKMLISNGPYPLATLTANVLSCLIMAVAVFFFNEKAVNNPAVRLFLLTGFCGGFSTFSTFSLETFALFKSGNAGFAILNIILNISICIGVVFVLSKKAGQ